MILRWRWVVGSSDNSRSGQWFTMAYSWVAISFIETVNQPTTPKPSIRCVTATFDEHFCGKRRRNHSCSPRSKLLELPRKGVICNPFQLKQEWENNNINWCFKKIYHQKVNLDLGGIHFFGMQLWQLLVSCHGKKSNGKRCLTIH